MARLTGVEPVTYPLGGGRSIQLSYRRLIFLWITRNKAIIVISDLNYSRLYQVS